MKKICVNQECCIGCGACVAIDPTHFAFNDDGLSHPISQENLESEELASAIDSCPTCAISIEEVKEDVQVKETKTCEDKDNCQGKKENKQECECEACECENCHCEEEE